ncbi:MAG: hypothetical protein HQQ73_10760 [Desulfobulbaceae bacterium]|nr:hypothetical protein [Desulfobulbaceae bacterium]
MERRASLLERLPESLRSAVGSSLIILKFVVPFYILSDILLYFDLLISLLKNSPVRA